MECLCPGMCTGTAEWVQRKKLEMMDPESRERQVFASIAIVIVIVFAIIAIVFVIQKFVLKRIVQQIIFNHHHFRRVNTTGFHWRQPEEIQPLQIVDMQV